VQRAAWRHELCRSATRATVLRAPLARGHSLLRRPAQREARRHRLVAGALSVRRVGGGFTREAPVRPVLRQEPLAVPRSADPDRYRAGGPSGQRRAVAGDDARAPEASSAPGLAWPRSPASDVPP